MVVRITKTTTFVDWNAQFYNYKSDRFADHTDKAIYTIEKLAETISRFLNRSEPGLYFQVQLRLYHGWYRGYETTVNRKAAISAIAQLNFAHLSAYPRVSFLPNVEFGDSLMDALPHRRKSKPFIHLPNTLRKQDGSDQLVEKMVDTALASDMLCWAKNDPSEWALVLAEDDDLVPPVFTAESWIDPFGGRIALLRHRKTSRNFLQLDGLVHQVSTDAKR